MVEYIQAKNNEEYTQAAILFREYAEWLSIDLGFQRFSEELRSLQSVYAEPFGALFMAKSGNEYLGCIAIRKFDEQIAELKRMYVKIGVRRKGTATALLEIALEKALDLGYEKIRLDTLSNMTPAISLYKKYGFYEISAYYYNPEKNAVYFEKILTDNF